MSDDVAYVQDFFDQGLPVPAGEYDCPRELVIPGRYIERARAAGREPDAPDGGFMLSREPGYATLNGPGGSYVTLTGYISPNPAAGDEPGDIWIFRKSCTFTMPYPQPVADLLQDISFGVLAV